MHYTTPHFFIQSECMIPANRVENSVVPDQMASSEASLSGSTVLQTPIYLDSTAGHSKPAETVFILF